MTLVVHIFGVMDHGGAELRTMDLMEQVAPRGVRFAFVTLSGNEGVLAERIRSMGGEVYPLQLDSNFPVRFVRLLRRLRPDVVDSHVATFSGAILALARLAGVPTRVAHFRSDGDSHPDNLRRWVQRGCMRQLIRLSSTDIVGVSPSSLRDGYQPNWQCDPRARIIANGVTRRPIDGMNGRLLQELGLPRGVPLLMHVGRPSAEKNRPRLIPVFEAVRAILPSAHLVLVGGHGADAADMDAALSRSSCQAAVHQIGVRDDVQGLMSQAQCVLLTSVREGLPGVVLEALAVGTPVVSSDVPGAVWIGERFDSVKPVSLTEPDAVWAGHIAAAVHTAEEQRAQRVELFAKSEFTIENAARAHLELFRAG